MITIVAGAGGGLGAVLVALGATIWYKKRKKGMAAVDTVLTGERKAGVDSVMALTGAHTAPMGPTTVFSSQSVDTVASEQPLSVSDVNIYRSQSPLARRVVSRSASNRSMVGVAPTSSSNVEFDMEGAAEEPTSVYSSRYTVHRTETPVYLQHEEVPHVQDLEDADHVGDAEEPLPPGWEEYWDEANQLPYYYNTQTKETQWEDPRD